MHENSQIAQDHIRSTQIRECSTTSVSICVCAYNEEANIEELLKSIQRQSLERVKIVQILIISSACLDGTDAIVQKFKDIDPRIELVKETRRNGKASAINTFLLRAKGDVCLLANADTILSSESVERICAPFFVKSVGMTGGRTIPVNDNDRFMGFISHLIWRLAHELSLEAPKLGEFVAFRNVIRQISEKTAVDEAYIESEIRSRGYSLCYVPEAVVYNKGPEKISDYIKQRRRIYAGHLELLSSTGYQVSSISNYRIARLLGRILIKSWRYEAWVLAAVLLECYARILGYYDFKFTNKNFYVWDVVSTTKNLSAGVTYKT